MYRRSQTDSPNRLGAPLTAVSIVLHNSDEHTLPYCIELLQHCFGYNERDAYQMAFSVHLDGRATIWIGGFELAELKCEQVAEFVPSLPLENHVSSPVHLSFPSQPMKVTIEPIQVEAAHNSPA